MPLNYTILTHEKSNTRSINMKIALISMEVIPGRPDLNAAAMQTKITAAKAAGAELALFPALSLSGLFLGGVWKQPAFLCDCAAYAEEIAAAADGITVVFGNAAEAESCTSVRRTLMEARDGMLREVAHSPLHGTGNTFAPLLYELPNENIILAADPSPSASVQAHSQRRHAKSAKIFSTSTPSDFKTRARRSTHFPVERMYSALQANASPCPLPTRRA